MIPLDAASDFADKIQRPLTEHPTAVIHVTSKVYCEYITTSLTRRKVIRGNVSSSLVQFFTKDSGMSGSSPLLSRHAWLRSRQKINVFLDLLECKDSKQLVTLTNNIVCGQQKDFACCCCDSTITVYFSVSFSGLSTEQVVYRTQ